MQRHLVASIAVGILVLALVAPCVTRAAVEPQTRTSLFDGQSFAGWVRYLRDNKGNVDETWQIKPDGVLACSGKPAGYLRTEQSYKNYKFRLEYRWPGKPGNNGVLVHATGEDRVWPQSLECQGGYGNQGDFWEIGGVRFNEHSVGGHRVKGRRVIKFAPSNEKEPGQWNVYEVWCVDGTVRPYVNGKLMNEATDCSLTEGRICLQSEGAPIEFRNITIEPAIDKPWPVIPTQRIELFNGEDLEGWIRFSPDDKRDDQKQWTVDRVWSVQDGVIHCSGKPHGYIKTTESYANYKLHLEWRWPEKPTNSGVLLHCAGIDRVWPKCVEAQLMHENAGDFWLINQSTLRVEGKQIGPKNYANAKKKHASNEKPTGQWNRYDILCDGGSVKLWINGLLQNEGVDANPAFGPICLQSEGSPIEFRNITLEPLDGGSGVAQRKADPDPKRFTESIKDFQTWDRKNSLPNNYVLMLGSSSIRMWPSAESFPELKVVNRGFGGAHISDLIHYQAEILTRYPAPQCIVFYCGGNDVTGGKGPEQVLTDFGNFRAIITRHAPACPLIYLPIKPCPSRWHLWEAETRVNEAIRQQAKADSLLIYADTVTPMLATGSPPDTSLFIKDLLHLSPKGYVLWTDVTRPLIRQAVQ